MSQEEHVRNLMRSKQLVGELSPVIIDFDNEILAGACRKKAGFLRTYKVDSRKLASKWEVPVRVAKERVRLSSNIQRRVSKEETQEILVKIAEAFEKQGVPKEQIASKVAENCPYSPKYVGELLPSKYKSEQKAEAGKKGGETTGARLSRAKTQDTRQPTVETRKYKPKETPEHRVAVMHPAVSKMDEAVYLALQQNETLRQAGWRFEFQKRYCIKHVRSDVTAIRGDVEQPLFLDGDVHIGKEERDEANRGILAHQLKIPEVYAFTYKGAYSDGKRDMIVAEIVEALT